MDISNFFHTAFKQSKLRLNPEYFPLYYLTVSFSMALSLFPSDPGKSTEKTKITSIHRTKMLSVHMSSFNLLIISLRRPLLSNYLG